MHYQRAGRHPDERHRCKRVERVEGHFRREMRRDGLRAGRAEHQGVAVRRRLGEDLRRDQAGVAWAVLDHHRLRHRFGELLRDDAREDVVRAAGGESDQHAQRALGKRLRVGVARNQRVEEEREEKRGGSSDEAGHGTPLCVYRGRIGVRARSRFCVRENKIGL